MFCFVLFCLIFALFCKFPRRPSSTVDRLSYSRCHFPLIQISLNSQSHGADAGPT